MLRSSQVPNLMNFGLPGVIGNEATSPRFGACDGLDVGDTRLGDDQRGGRGLEDPDLVDFGVHHHVALAEGGVRLVFGAGEFLDVKRRDVRHDDRVVRLEIVDLRRCR